MDQGRLFTIPVGEHEAVHFLLGWAPTAWHECRARLPEEFFVPGVFDSRVLGAGESNSQEDPRGVVGLLADPLVFIRLLRRLPAPALPASN